MAVNGPRRVVAGVETSFDAFSDGYDRAFQARTRGLSAQQSGFAKDVTRHGDYLGQTTLEVGHAHQGPHHPQQQAQGFGSGSNGGRRHTPDMPYPKQQQRDDLEAQYIPRTRPRAF